MPKIAAETGGGYFELTRADDLRSTFARVADELHQQYALGFQPTKLDGKSHDLEVKVKVQGDEGAGAQELPGGKGADVLRRVQSSPRHVAAALLGVRAAPLGVEPLQLGRA